jgi:threonine synthase
MTSTPRLRCFGCRRTPAVAAQDFRCTDCGDVVELVYEWPSLDPGHLKSVWRDRRVSSGALDQSGVWRFREVLPLLNDEPITLREGNTPVYKMHSCARVAGVDDLYAKHQGLNPTGSFKDTGMTVAASFAREAKFGWVACASTGNTSASMAAYAARGSMRSLVLIPEGKISWSKLSQALDYGALTCQLRTDFDGCMRVLNEIVRRMPIYLLNSVNPYRLEGQKTAAFELLEHFDWEVPDHVIVPGGNLGNSSALGKAFIEMRQLGLITKLPKISIIQAEGANPLVRAMRENGGETLSAMQADTMATAIRIGNPASWKKAVRVLQTTGGTAEQVSEVEIACAKAEIGADGIGCEPASAVTLAGLKKLVRYGFVKRPESVVLILTGHMMKDPEFTLKFHRGDLFADDAQVSSSMRRLQRRPIVLDADTDEVLRLLEGAGRVAAE